MASRQELDRAKRLGLTCKAVAPRDANMGTVLAAQAKGHTFGLLCPACYHPAWCGAVHTGCAHGMGPEHCGECHRSCPKVVGECERHAAGCPARQPYAVECTCEEGRRAFQQAIGLPGS